MKFRLSTLLAIVTIVALTLGWGTERIRRIAQMKSYVQERQSLKVANRSIGGAIEACFFADRIKNVSEDKARIILDATLLAHILEIWKNHESVSYTLDQTHCAGMTSHAITSMLLDALQCATPEDFQARVSQVVKADPSLLPGDLSDLKSSEFRSYIQASIDYYH